MLYKSCVIQHFILHKTFKKPCMLQKYPFDCKQWNPPIYVCWMIKWIFQYYNDQSCDSHWDSYNINLTSTKQADVVRLVVQVRHVIFSHIHHNPEMNFIPSKMDVALKRVSIILVSPLAVFSHTYFLQPKNSQCTQTLIDINYAVMPHPVSKSRMKLRLLSYFASRKTQASYSLFAYLVLINWSK